MERETERVREREGRDNEIINTDCLFRAALPWTLVTEWAREGFGNMWRRQGRESVLNLHWDGAFAVKHLLMQIEHMLGMPCGGKEP